MSDTTITDIDIPFFRLIVIILKFWLAAIPAAILLWLTIVAIILGTTALLGGGCALLNHSLKSSSLHEKRPVSSRVVSRAPRHNLAR